MFWEPYVMHYAGKLWIVSGLFLVSVPTTWAAPPGRSLHVSPRPAGAGLPAAAAPAAAASLPAPSGLSKQAGDAAKLGNGLPRAAASMSQAPTMMRPLPSAATSRALSAGVAAPVGPQEGPEAVGEAARHAFEHRLRQAAHLEEIAQQNGNEQLGDTAQQMREQAQRQYDATMQRVARMPDAPAAPTDDTTIDTAPATDSFVPPPTVPATQAQPRWRDRLHFSWPFKR